MRFAGNNRYRHFHIAPASAASTSTAEATPHSEDSSESFLAATFQSIWNGTEAWTLPERPNSLRALKFARLLETIRRMADLPPDHNFHVDSDTARKSEAILALLSNNFELEPPKMFPQEGESLVLTWDYPAVKRYLTVDGSELDLLDLNKRTKVRCAHELSFDNAQDLKDWILQLGGTPSSISDANNADAL